MTEGGRSTVCVYGSSGVGKSAFLAHWRNVGGLLDSDDCWYVLRGAGSRSRTVLDVALWLIYFLKNILQEVEGFERAKPDGVESQDIVMRVLQNLSRECDATLKGPSKDNHSTRWR